MIDSIVTCVVTIKAKCKLTTTERERESWIRHAYVSQLWSFSSDEIKDLPGDGLGKVKNKLDSMRGFVPRMVSVVERLSLAMAVSQWTSRERRGGHARSNSANCICLFLSSGLTCLVSASPVN